MAFIHFSREFVLLFFDAGPFDAIEYQAGSKEYRRFAPFGDGADLAAGLPKQVSLSFTPWLAAAKTVPIKAYDRSGERDVFHATPNPFQPKLLPCLQKF
ncbi:hypothetical protein [Teredinibacter turnerae]|uniref:hypothetical protein n=1 Tax=Teredinibacter turnerae TaxID=2426 RepID=UPI00040995F8|nr:hypothetical protein [Teredinibacter turnerae]